MYDLMNRFKSRKNASKIMTRGTQMSMKELHSNNGVAPELKDVISLLEETIPVLRNSLVSNFKRYEIIVRNEQGEIVVDVRKDKPVRISEDIIDRKIFLGQWLVEATQQVQKGMEALAQKIPEMKDDVARREVEETMHLVKEKILTANELVSIACSNVK